MTPAGRLEILERVAAMDRDGAEEALDQAQIAAPYEPVAQTLRRGGYHLAMHLEQLQALRSQ